MQKKYLKTTGLCLAAIGTAVLFTQCGGEKHTEMAMETFDKDYLDTTVSPEQDFYRFANGNWIKETTIPDSESRWGSFNEVSERNDSILKIVIETAAGKTDAEKGSADQMVGDYYASFKNWEKRNAEGYKAYSNLVDELRKTPIKELPQYLAKLNTIGMGGLFGFGISSDLKNSNINAMYFSQPRLGLRDKTYYFGDTEKQQEQRAEYKKHLAKMSELTGNSFNPENAYNVEEMLANVSMDATERRNIPALYNKYSFSDFNALAKSFDFKTFLETAGADIEDSVIVTQPEVFKNMDAILKDNYAAVQDYLAWSMLNNMAGVLNKALDDQNFAFYGTYLRGTKSQKEDWKRGVDVLTGGIGEVLGQAFVDQAFSAESKKRVNEMVDNMAIVLEARLKDLNWMSDETKEKAILKMNSFKTKLGYPDKWEDYTSINLTRDSYVQNWMEVQKYEYNDMLSKQGQPVDKTEWGMAPHIVNAYYNPSNNEIVFPAGIMQPPFFNPEAEDAVNYARMGAVIGHEMIHGFDDNGSRFDHAGSLKNWWTEDDKTKFSAQADRLAELYSEYEVIPGSKVNGKLTLGENIADFGGLTLAYHAYMKSLEGKEKEVIDGYTPEQRFFISFAQIWKGVATDAFYQQQVTVDPHSPTEFRVNGTLRNMPEFFAAFDVEKGDAMRNSDERIVSIW